MSDIFIAFLKDPYVQNVLTLAIDIGMQKEHRSLATIDIDCDLADFLSVWESNGGYCWIEEKDKWGEEAVFTTRGYIQDVSSPSFHPADDGVQDAADMCYEVTIAGGCNPKFESSLGGLSRVIDFLFSSRISQRTLVHPHLPGHPEIRVRTPMVTPIAGGAVGLNKPPIMVPHDILYSEFIRSVVYRGEHVFTADNVVTVRREDEDVGVDVRASFVSLRKGQLVEIGLSLRGVPDRGIQREKNDVEGTSTVVLHLHSVRILREDTVNILGTLASDNTEIVYAMSSQSSAM